MRRPFLLALLPILACASSQGGSMAPVPDQTLRIPTSGAATRMTTISIASSIAPSVRMFVAPMDRVWNALPSVYAELGLPLTDRDSSDRTMGSSSFKLRRRLGDVPLSRYLDCGSTQGAPSADSYEILLTVHSSVQSGQAGSTVVSTTVDAMGRPVFVSSEYIHCGSKGGLE